MLAMIKTKDGVVQPFRINPKNLEKLKNKYGNDIMVDSTNPLINFNRSCSL